MNKDKFKKIPIIDAVKVPERGGFYEIMKNKYWAVTEDDCILLYNGYAKQCNSNEIIAKSIVKYKEHPSVKVVFLDTVFLPHDCSDY